MDDYYNRHPRRFPHGRPIAKRPPARVAINLNDALTVDAATFLKTDPDVTRTHGLTGSAVENMVIKKNAPDCRIQVDTFRVGNR